MTTDPPKVDPLPTWEVAYRLFRYDPETGVITRKVTLGGQKAGSVVGYLRKKDGYLGANVKKRAVLLHRLAWLLHYKCLPPAEVDHRNGIRTDNRAKNLRDATRLINNQNRRKAHKNNRLGVLGVHQVPSGRFKARIRVNKVLKIIGTYDTAAEASEAYLQAKRQLHPGNTL